MKRFINSYVSDGLGWVRIFGVGISWKDTRRHPLRFSERKGYKRFVRLGNYVITYLPIT